MSTRRSPRNSLPTSETTSSTGNSIITSSALTLSSRLRSSRRISVARAIAEDAGEETPHDALRQLADNVIRPRTPLRRASSAGPPSIHGSIHRTPAAFNRTPGATTRPGSMRRPTAATPHGRAAIREIELRRAAALTPGKSKKQVIRQRKDTPRDVLRALSAVLAPGTSLIDSSPQDLMHSGDKLATKGNADIDDDEQLLQRPRLSIPLNGDEDDSLLLPPIPSATTADDETATQRSIELPRRAVSEQPGRLSRGSYGSTRTSDRFEDQSELRLDAAEAGGPDSSFIQQQNFEEYQAMEPEDSASQEDFTGDLRQAFLNNDGLRVSTGLRSPNDIKPGAILEDDLETTFVLTVPQTVPLISGRPRNQSSLPEFNADSNDGSAQSEALRVNEMDQANAHGDADLLDTTLNTRYKLFVGRPEGSKMRGKAIKLSKHGVQYSSLPAANVRKLATTFLRTSGNSRAKLSNDTLEAIMQASEWFLEQVSDDLGVYSDHTGTKTIDESDVLTLMKRQRQTSTTTTPFALAQKYLPRELLQHLRMAQPAKLKKGRRLERVAQDNGNE
ncbi:MAG: hypothetical protein M1818_004876 [Claussenomyces sp. TS43310]|nr:MAG: hypothetical protein M1818_004876 [Claussenomyces sp. TS43310]